jgi:hypothetical protein
MSGCRRANKALGGVCDRREERIKTRAADLAGSKEQPVAAGESLKERLRFETPLFDISARFMATPLDQIDSEIDNALMRPTIPRRSCSHPKMDGWISAVLGEHL